MPSTTRLTFAAFTNGRDSPSARFRVRQHIDPLSDLGVDMVEYPSRWSGSLGKNIAASAREMGVAVTHRTWDVIRSYRSSGTLLQRWMLSRFPTFEFAARGPRVLDVDDAIWQDSGPDATKWLAAQCSGIVCGNSFLAERFSRWNPNTTIVPTAVDTERFRPADSRERDRPQIVCWSGSASTLKYLYGVEQALARVLQCNPQVTLRTVCNTPPRFTCIPAARTEYVKWSEGCEVSAIQDCAVGIMPLDDSEWARGKCSFKMLCYMACGVPTVVSPVGMNNEVLILGQAGLAPKSGDDWVNALDYILKNPTAGRAMGVTGRSVVERHFSGHIVARQLAAALRHYAELS